MQIGKYDAHSSCTTDFTKKRVFFNVWENRPWSHCYNLKITGLHLLFDLSLH